VGLFQFSLDSNKFFYCDLKDSRTKKSYDASPGICVDKYGKVWLSTLQLGLVIYDPVNKSVDHPVFDEQLMKSISAVNYSIYCDREGVVWSGAGNMKGFYQLIPFSKAAILYSHINTPDIIRSEHVTSVQNGINKELWIGTIDGLHIFNVFKNSSHVLTKRDMPGIPSDAIFGFITDTISQKAWVHVDDANGLYEMDMQTKKCRPVIFKDSVNNIINGYRLAYLTKTEEGCLVRLLTHGIYKISKDSNIATQIITLPSQKITSIVPAKYKSPLASLH
jgi:hypothetical protein